MSLGLPGPRVLGWGIQTHPPLLQLFGPAFQTWAEDPLKPY